MPEVIIVPSLFFMIGYVVWVLANTWSRRSRLKLVTEFHSKLLDKLGSVRDFGEFVQTEGGARFMADLGAEPASIGGPYERILRAAQLGIVLLCLGVGLLLLSFLSPTLAGRVQESFNAFGTVTLSLGVGFIISAVASYRLSGKLGLLGGASSATREPRASRP